MDLNKKVFLPKTLLTSLIKRIDNFNGNKKSKGYITAINLKNNGFITLANLKKIKNTLETSDDSSVQFLLGDKDFVNWYETLLKRRSERIQRNKNNKERAGFNNPHRKSHEKTSFIHSEGINRNIKIFVNENIYSKIINHGMF